MTELSFVLMLQSKSDMNDLGKLAILSRPFIGGRDNYGSRGPDRPHYASHSQSFSWHSKVASQVSGILRPAGSWDSCQELDYTVNLWKSRL
jgi:hypothetical protein